MKDYRQYEPIFGVWHITKLLGEGSLGKVFEMESERCGTVAKAALKVIPLLPDRDDAGGRTSTTPGLPRGGRRMFSAFAAFWRRERSFPEPAQDQQMMDSLAQRHADNINDAQGKC